jgi:lysozyme family protein
MTPTGCIRNYIKTHEGGLSLDKDDTGNWHHGALVGSKYGVTGDVLARYRGVPAVTAKDMAELTLDEAVQIGLKLFYFGPHLDQLLWNRVTASVVDMAWGAGPVQAIKLLQRLIGAEDDGQCGPGTARLYAGWIGRVGEQSAAHAYADARNHFYAQICVTHPTNNKFLRGWQNRSNSFLPATPWWNQWSAAA